MLYFLSESCLLFTMTTPSFTPNDKFLLSWTSPLIHLSTPDITELKDTIDSTEMMDSALESVVDGYTPIKFLIDGVDQVPFTDEDMEEYLYLLLPTPVKHIWDNVEYKDEKHDLDSFVSPVHSATIMSKKIPVNFQPTPIAMITGPSFNPNMIQGSMLPLFSPMGDIHLGTPSAVYPPRVYQRRPSGNDAPRTCTPWVQNVIDYV
jgi:hypothetical protein